MAAPKPKTSVIEALEYQFLPIERLCSAPYNPRKKFDEPALNELAESIKKHGIVEPLIVRPVEAGLGVGFEVVAGGRRLRAAHIAQLETVPCLVKNLSDSEAFAICVLENYQREDLTPVERARSIQMLVLPVDQDGAGLTQAEVAKQIGCTQPTIAKQLALLSLPQSVLDMVDAETLDASKAVLLTLWAGWPDACEILAVWASRNTKSYVEETIKFQSLPDKWQLEEKGLIRDLKLAMFDTNQCKTCPHNALFTRDDKNNVGTPDGKFWCFAPKEFDKKQDAARQIVEKKRREIAKSGDLDAPETLYKEVVESGDKTKIKQAIALLPTRGKAANDLGLKKWDLQTINETYTPEGCSTDCICRVYCQDEHRPGAMEMFCADKKRYERLQQKSKREERKGIKEEAAEATQKLWESVTKKDFGSIAMQERAFIFATEQIVNGTYNLKADTRRALGKMEFIHPKFREYLAKSHNSSEESRAALTDIAEEVGYAVLLTWAALAKAVDAPYQAISYGSTSLDERDMRNINYILSGTETKLFGDDVEEDAQDV
jgi:ParB/RepB/Spo0J family partition protein